MQEQQEQQPNQAFVFWTEASSTLQEAHRKAWNATLDAKAAKKALEFASKALEDADKKKADAAADAAKARIDAEEK